ncbi:hypothetical protein DL96DRAFT_1599355, partial [Flagelloscypha sp. PMI_526]
MNFEDGEGPPPGTGPTRSFEGPWFETQIIISLALGITSFLVFSYARTRWPLLFAPRTKLKGFSPHTAHDSPRLFGWILPTIRTSEFTVLQIVGLDAAVLLSFFKMSFYLFSLCSFYAVAILMPINWSHNKDLLGSDDDDPEGEDDDWLYSRLFANDTGGGNTNTTLPGGDWLDLINDANTYLSVHLVTVYVFTLLTLFFLWRNYRRFLRSRQLFSLELVHSIPARTILVTNIPMHLRGERALAEYFESLDLLVESVSLVREVEGLKKLLDWRTDRLGRLEKAWCEYVGNPSTVEEYNPEGGPLIDMESQLSNARPNRQQLVVPNKPRPTLRPVWWKVWYKVDKLEYYEKQFTEADEQFRKRRRLGKFRATQSAFITFEKMSHAQTALQMTHYPLPNYLSTYAAPEPRDIVWANMTPTPSALLTRDLIVMGCVVVLFFTYLIPIAALASLLSIDEINKTLPWLGELIESNEKIKALVQNSLPSVAMIALNALLPSLLEALCYVQGFRARSWVEYSLLKKYFLFLLINVVFIFLLASTYWQLIQDLANDPGKIPERLARALGTGRAMHFFLSYVILQGLGIMPLQLLNLGVIIPRIMMRMFVTRTPRDFAELNAPPMINYGTVYPQAILIFVITLLYSVVQPLILIFGAIYFGIAYVVYKYKLLFVFYKPYESQGQAWPITFVRLVWGIIIFLIFMAGYFALKSAVITSGLVLPLLVGILFWSWWIYKSYHPLGKYVATSSVYEVERGVESTEVTRFRAGHPVTWSQSNLMRRRYAQNDDTLYVAPEDERTDYSQPPMANWYHGVLNTGKRRYGHPALNGVLPEPWLPLKKGQTLVNRPNDGSSANGGGKGENLAVVLTLRKRSSVVGRKRKSLYGSGMVGNDSRSQQQSSQPPDLLTGDDSAGPSNTSDNPWSDEPSTPRQNSPTLGRRPTLPGHTSALNHRLSFDAASGVIMLPDQAEDWLDGTDDDGSETDSDHEDYGAPATPTRMVSGQPVLASSNSGGSRVSLASLGPRGRGERLDSTASRIRVDSSTSTHSISSRGQPPRPRSVGAVRALEDDTGGQILANLPSSIRSNPAPQLDTDVPRVTESPSAMQTRQLTSDGEDDEGDTADEAVDAGGESGSTLRPSASTPSRTSRYGTYFHHPERRRASQMIPGAFPR